MSKKKPLDMSKHSDRTLSFWADLAALVGSYSGDRGVPITKGKVEWLKTSPRMTAALTELEAAFEEESRSKGFALSTHPSRLKVSQVHWKTIFEFLISRRDWLKLKVYGVPNNPGDYEVALTLDGYYTSKEVAERVKQLFTEDLDSLLQLHNKTEDS